jgi:putative inorganic carbon (HCO3(-)) transporter
VGEIVRGDGAAQTEFNPGLIGWVLAGYVFFLPVQLRTQFDLRLAPSDLVLVPLLLLTLTELSIRRSAWSFWHVALLAVLTGGILNAALATGAASRYAVLNKGIGLLLLLGGYLAITSFVRSWPRLRWVLRVFVLSVLLHAVIAISGFFGSLLFGFRVAWLNSYSGRLSGMLIDPNAFGGLLVVTFAIHMVGGYSTRPLLEGRLRSLTTLVLPIAILLTYSRSSWLGLTAVLIIGSFYRPRMLIRVAALGMVAVGTALLILGQQYFEIMVAMAARPQQIQNRLDLIREAYEVFGDHPWFGIGVGGFWQSTGVGVHNTTLWFLTEFGIFGLGAFLAFASWFMIKSYYARRLAPPEEKPLIFGLLLAHFAMLGLSFGIEALYQRHWWLIMALIGAGYSITRWNAVSPSTGGAGDESEQIAHPPVGALSQGMSSS